MGKITKTFHTPKRQTEHLRPPGTPLSHLRDDRLLLLLLVSGIAANIFLFAYLGWHYQSLPQFLPLHYTALGEVDRIGTKSEVFKLPAIGLIVLGANASFGLLVYGRERTLAYLLLGAAILEQLLFWWVAFNIVY